MHVIGVNIITIIIVVIVVVVIVVVVVVLQYYLNVRSYVTIADQPLIG